MGYTKSAVEDVFFNEVGDGILQKKKYADIIDALRPDSTFTLNVMNDNIFEYFTMEKEGFKDMIGGKLIDVYPLVWTRNDLEYDE